MYAVVRTGGKQYTVRPGDVIRIEKLNNDLGSEVELTDILLVGGDRLVEGKPNVPNAKITAVVTQQAKDAKILIFKKKRRQGYRRMKGHRQLFTEIFVKSISLDGKSFEAEGQPQIIDVVAKRAERAAARNEISAEGAEASAGSPAKKSTKTASRGKKSAPAKKTTKSKSASGAKKKATAKPVKKAAKRS